MPGLLKSIIIGLVFASSCAVAQTPQKGNIPVDTSFLINIDGLDQYLEIKGVSRSKPVLLFLHGGPSWPATPMLRKYNQALTNDFVLVSWDQRNCGKSKTDTAVTLTVDLYVEDAHQVTQFLKKTFKTSKIFIIGNSWGSVIGVTLASKYPEDYFAYIGVGQVVDLPRSLMVTKDYVVNQARLKNDTSTINAIDQMGISADNVYSLPFEHLMNFFQVANPYLKNANVRELEDATQLYPDYQVVDWFTPLITSGKELFVHMNSTRLDLSRYKEFKIPMYFFAGKHDYNTPSIVAEEFFNSITAPKRKFFWFERSGHSPQWEEPEVFHRRLVEIAGSKE